MEKSILSLHPEDEKLISGFENNDRHSLEVIYTKNFKSVEHYIITNNGRSDDAKDIYQEAILAAWLNVKEGKFTPQNSSSLGGYIFQISKYKWLDRLKSKAYKSTMRIERDEQIDQPEEEIGESEIQESRIDYLKELYAQLDEKCKEILQRFYYEKKNLETIGEELNYDAGTVKTLKYRCMKKLKSFHAKSNSPRL